MNENVSVKALVRKLDRIRTMQMVALFLRHVHGSELRALHNRDGSLKSLTAGVFDAPYVTTTVKNGRKAKESLSRHPYRPLTVPTPDEARSMDLSKLRRFIPTQGGSEEDERSIP